MIVLIIILATVLTFATWMYLSKPLLRYVLGTLSLFVLGSSIYLLTDHFVNHRGMEVKTTVLTKQIYSSGDTSQPFGIMIAKEIGTKSGRYVMIYRDKEGADPTAHFVPNKKKMTETVKKSSSYKLVDTDKASVSIKTKRYVWKNHFYELLFNVGGENNELVSQEVDVLVPKETWMVLSPKEAKSLKSALPKLKETSAKNPDTAKMMANLIRNNPKEAAKLQIKAIQALLKESK
ncbi:MAG: DUF4811 domain-containing protein [Streptococcus sp.]|nr:DUF4811 domain-containing protein [Streptococcus sp.]